MTKFLTPRGQKKLLYGKLKTLFVALSVCTTTKLSAIKMQQCISKQKKAFEKVLLKY